MTNEEERSPAPPREVGVPAAIQIAVTFYLTSALLAGGMAIGELLHARPSRAEQIAMGATFLVLLGIGAGLGLRAALAWRLHVLVSVALGTIGALAVWYLAVNGHGGLTERGKTVHVVYAVLGLLALVQLPFTVGRAPRSWFKAGAAASPGWRECLLPALSALVLGIGFKAEHNVTCAKGRHALIFATEAGEADAAMFVRTLSPSWQTREIGPGGGFEWDEDDPDHIRPTFANYGRALDAMAAASAPGDELLVFAGSHCTPPRTGADWTKIGSAPHSAFRMLFADGPRRPGDQVELFRRLPRDRRVVFVSDCCFAEVFLDAVLEERDGRYRPMPGRCGFATSQAGAWTFSKGNGVTAFVDRTESSPSRSIAGAVEELQAEIVTGKAEYPEVPLATSDVYLAKLGEAVQPSEDRVDLGRAAKLLSSSDLGIIERKGAALTQLAAHRLPAGTLASESGRVVERVTALTRERAALNEERFELVVGALGKTHPALAAMLKARKPTPGGPMDDENRDSGSEEFRAAWTSAKELLPEAAARSLRALDATRTANLAERASALTPYSRLFLMAQTDRALRGLKALAATGSQEELRDFASMLRCEATLIR